MASVTYGDPRHPPRALSVRAHPLVLGVVLFLASELMLFAALFAAYFDLRATAAVWPPPDVHLDLGEASFGTLLLLLSSVTAVMTTRALDGKKFIAARSWIGATLIAAVGFVIIAIHGYMHDTFTISSNAYGSIYYAMTGLHLLHVTAGIGILLSLLIGLRSPALLANHRAGAEAMTYYWHFVFIVWVGLWATIYFVR